MNRDPLKEAGGLNLYGFVQNNPINWFDPEGLAGSGRPVRPSKPNSNNSSAKRLLDDLGEIPDFNLGDPDCVYRPVNKCVKINCNKDVDSTCKGPWVVKDVSTDCWCEEWKTVLECR
jgi:hypothetical protein